jgi:Hypothetical methyltransferase
MVASAIEGCYPKFRAWCGEAKIHSEFGDRVYSFDHITINNKVMACDMKSTGLPDEAIDIAVFSLTLMGRNWDAYIAEAKRCLATGGLPSRY